MAPFEAATGLQSNMVGLNIKVSGGLGLKPVTIRTRQTWNKTPSEPRASQIADVLVEPMIVKVKNEGVKDWLEFMLDVSQHINVATLVQPWIQDETYCKLKSWA